MADAFNTLRAVNVNGHTEERNGLTYLSWAWAWDEAIKRYPDATYEVWKDENHRPYVFDPLTGYMVFTTVTIDGVTREMWLPVMDSANNAMKAEPYSYKVANKNFKYAKKAEDGRFYDRYGNVQTEYIEKHVDSATMFDINKTIMRCLTKNLAMFGLGLYIYAGTDLPEIVQAENANVVEGPSGDVVVKDERPNKSDNIASVETISQSQVDSIIAILRDRFDNNADRNNAFVRLRDKYGIPNLKALMLSKYEEAVELAKVI